jgi:hypothetical protein
MMMSAVDSRHSPALMVPATGFAEIIAPFRHDGGNMPPRPGMETERNWHAEGDRRNVDDYVALLRFVA